MTIWKGPLLVASLSIFGFLPSARSSCYHPDGTLITETPYQPCNQVAGAISVCCGTNWTGGVVAKDICEPNGLCLNSYEGRPLYWRGSCTDKTWKSPLCLPNLCTNPSNGGDPTANVALIECTDGSWCCGGNNQTCCDEGLGTRLAATLSLSASSSSTSASSSPSSTSSQQSATSPVFAPSQTDTTPSASTPTVGASNKSSKVAIAVGLGVGMPVFIIAVAFALVGFFFVRRSKRRNDYRANGALSQAEEKCELPGNDIMAHEVRGDEVAHEVQGDYRKSVKYEVSRRTGPAELSSERL